MDFYIVATLLSIATFTSAFDFLSVEILA